MEQLESTNRDLQLTTERMRTVEAQRIAANKEVEMQRMQVGSRCAVVWTLHNQVLCHSAHPEADMTSLTAAVNAALVECSCPSLRLRGGLSRPL
jgi:hypothetical protein